MNKSVFNSTAWSHQPCKLAVLVPTRDTMHSVTAASLINMMKTNTLASVDTHVIMDASTILLNQRERLAEQAIESGAEFMLWIDSDMMFPSTTALRLLAHNQHIVAANYMKRSNPMTTVGYERVGDWDSWLPLQASDALVEVEGIGMGCMLMDTRIVAALPKPWFAFEYDKREGWMGEDFYLLGNLRAQGHKVMVDMNLSRQIRHIGNWAFGPSIGTNEEQIAKRRDTLIQNREILQNG